MNPYFIHCEIHRGQLIGIEETPKGYQFHLFTYGSVSCPSESGTHFPTIEAAINAALLEAEVHFQFECGVDCCERGCAIPPTATPHFVRGWQLCFSGGDEDH